MDYSEKSEIKDTSIERPHVFILGAGASRAAFPNGDKHGKIIPLMNELVEVVGLGDLVKGCGIEAPYDDFESIYSKIESDLKLKNLKEQIALKVFDYFSNLELPEKPTLYDHLVLSLRPKDVIATFNWDPFLWNAVERNIGFMNGKPPSILFLHGSVSIAKCESCKKVFPRYPSQCQECEKEKSEIPILYPVTKKDYQSDAAIKAHWRNLEENLQKAYILTVFGYSAPKTDVEAIDLLKKGWGDPEKRNLEQVELIDIQNKKILRKNWEDFIHSHHFDIIENFYDSWAANHPRRSCEAFFAETMYCAFLDSFLIPKDLGFNELYKWLEPRLKVE